MCSKKIICHTKCGKVVLHRKYVVSNDQQLKQKDTMLIFSIFLLRKKNYLMLSLAMSVRPSVRPSSVEIYLERGSKRSAEPIDIKIGLNIWIIR